MLNLIKKKKNLFILFFIQAIILIVAVTNFFICKSNLYNEIFIPSDLNLSTAEVLDEKIIITPENSNAGFVVSSSPLTLPRGSYIVYIDYSASMPGNTFGAYCAASTAHLFHSNPTPLSVNSKNAYITLDVGSTEDVTLMTNYSGNGQIEIYSMSIHETTNMAKRDFLYALLFCILISLAYFIYTGDINRKKTAFCLGLIIFLSSYPLFLDYMVIGHDLPFHLNRIDSIKLGLEQGIFPVKIQPFWIYDYGYATGVFYGDILLYFPALLRILGMSVQSAYMTFVTTINIGTAIIAYFSFKKILNNSRLGLIASMLYTLSYYRLLNVYTRAAVGEYCAMMFLPLIFVGFYQIFTHTNRHQKDYIKLAILPTIGLSGIINSHILSCEMVAIFVILLCIIFIKKIFKWQYFCPLLLTVIFTILLNLGFLVPFLDYYLTEEFIINSSQWQSGNVQNLGLYFTQIFGIFQNGTGGSFSTPSGIVNEFCPGLGLPLVIAFWGIAYFLFTTNKKQTQKSSYNIALLCFTFGMLCIIMSSIHFPWAMLENTTSIGRAIVSSIQFPWRFISLATLFITVGICFVLKQIPDTQIIDQEKSNLNIWSYAIITFCITSLLSTGWYYHSYLANGTPYRIYDTYELPSIQIYSAEYLPAGSTLQDFHEMRYAVSPNLTFRDVQKNGTTLQCYIENGSGKGYLEVPLINYKGYIAHTVQDNAPLTIKNGYNNCIRVDIPANFTGNILIEFVSPIYWKIAEIISTVSAILLIAFIIFNSKLKRSVTP